MAPEQLLAREVDGRTDLYAVGVTLYECLAGVVPFEGNFGEVLLKSATEPVPPLRQKAPEVSAEFAAVIERALAREPDDRFSDALALAQALRRAAPAIAPSSLLGIKQGPPPVPLRPSVLSAAVLDSAGRASTPSMARPAPVPPPLPATRRRFPRAPYVTPVRIYHGETVLDGRSEDVSVGGLLVLAPQAFEQAELVNVRWALPMTGRVIEISATARWVKAAGVRGAVGLQFTALPSDAHAVIDRYVTMMGGE
jgi:serine/threonine protein kinase